MRFLVFLMLLFMSIPIFAQSSRESNEKQFATSMRKEVNTLILDGRNEVKKVKDRELNRYFVALLRDTETTINSMFGLKYGYYGEKAQSERKNFYENTIKPNYQNIVSQIRSKDYSRTIESGKRQEIEGALLEYQKDIVGNISHQFIKALSLDSLQKGTMSFSYESGSSYVRVRLQDYSVTQSLKRDEQTMTLTLKADYNMDIPGKKNCDYDESWNYRCTYGSGTHVAGYTNAKITFSQFGTDSYIQISDFDMKADVSGIEKVAMEQMIEALKEYTNGKTYHIGGASSISKQGGLEILEKVGSLLELLENTSILTPVIRVGNEYILNWNPLFLTKFTTIIGNNEIPSGYMFPEFRYKDGVFSLNTVESDTTTIALQIAKNSEGKSIGTLDIYDIGMKNSLTLSLGKDLWKMRLSMPEFNVNNDWNGSTTLTEISGSGMSELFKSFMYGFSPLTKLDESMLPKKLRISGNLNSSSVSLRFDADTTTFATIDTFTNGLNTNYRLYMNLFAMKIELAGNAFQDYGTYSITKPVNAIELDTKKSGKLQKSLGDLSDTVMSR